LTESASRVVASALGDIMTIHLRNMEAFAKAQQALIDGNKSLLEQQIDIFRSMTEQVLRTAQGIASETDPRSNLAKRFEAAKASMQDGIGNANILSEMSARSGAQAAQIIQNRTFEALDELEAVLEGMLAAGSAASGRRS
jgi:phasin family protein